MATNGSLPSLLGAPFAEPDVARRGRGRRVAQIDARSRDSGEIARRRERVMFASLDGAVARSRARAPARAPVRVVTEDLRVDGEVVDGEPPGARQRIDVAPHARHGATVCVYAMTTRREPFFGIGKILSSKRPPRGHSSSAGSCHGPGTQTSSSFGLLCGAAFWMAPRQMSRRRLLDELAVDELAVDLEREPLDLRAGGQREAIDALELVACRSRTSRRSRCARRAGDADLHGVLREVDRVVLLVGAAGTPRAELAEAARRVVVLVALSLGEKIAARAARAPAPTGPTSMPCAEMSASCPASTSTSFPPCAFARTEPRVTCTSVVSSVAVTVSSVPTTSTSPFSREDLRGRSVREVRHVCSHDAVLHVHDARRGRRVELNLRVAIEHEDGAVFHLEARALLAVGRDRCAARDEGALGDGRVTAKLRGSPAPDDLRHLSPPPRRRRLPPRVPSDSRARRDGRQKRDTERGSRHFPRSFHPRGYGPAARSI